MNDKQFIGGGILLKISKVLIFAVFPAMCAVSCSEPDEEETAVEKRDAGTTVEAHDQYSSQPQL